jgi:hypothetical protein
LRYYLSRGKDPAEETAIRWGRAEIPEAEKML